MQHTAKSSFRNELSGTKHLEFTTSAKVKWLSHQISNYEEAALTNPFYVIFGALRFIFRLLTYPSVVLELSAYFGLYFLVIAANLAAEGRHLKLPEELEDLISKLSTVCAFLLAFYVGQSITRWWRLRTGGIGGIWSANNTIAPLLGVVYRSVKHLSPSTAELVLSAMKRIRRYSAVSLFYFFLKSGQSGFDEDGLLRLGLLTQEELQRMQSLPGTQSEYLWAVVGTECGKIAKAVSKLSDLDPALRRVWGDKLCDLWMRGRSGAGLTAAQIGCPVLYDYSSLVPLFVRLTITGIIAVHALQAADSHDIDLTNEHLAQNLLAVFVGLIPMLFYALILIALVIISIDAQNPFNDARTAFPGFRYINGLLEDFDILSNVDLKREGASRAERRPHSAGATFVAV